MGMYVQNTPKCLRHGDDPGTGFWVPGGFAQQLVDGLIRKANEISEQLASVHEIRTEHFWNGESPQAMADVFQKLILEQGGKGGGPLGVSHLSLAKRPSATPRPPFGGGGSESNVELWPDLGTEMAGDNRTSLIVDPPDGTVPPRTAAGQLRFETVGAPSRQRSADGPEDRALKARCIMWTPTPLLPTYSNNNVQVFQTRDYVAIYHEMIHDVGIIPLDGRLHLDERIRQLRGDARGHWEGDTLVVETTNFTAQSTFVGSGPNLRLVERFHALRFAYPTL